MTKNEKIKELIKNQKYFAQYLNTLGDHPKELATAETLEWMKTQEALTQDIADDAHSEAWDSYKPAMKEEVKAFTGFTKQ